MSNYDDIDDLYGNFENVEQNIVPVYLGEINSVNLGVFSAEEIRNISVLQLSNNETLAPSGIPSVGGLSDSRLGANSTFSNQKSWNCDTCGLSGFEDKNGLSCTGHFGHIELEAKMYHIKFMDVLQYIFESTCTNCFNFRLDIDQYINDDLTIKKNVNIPQNILSILKSKNNTTKRFWKMSKEKTVCENCDEAVWNLLKSKKNITVLQILNKKTGETKDVDPTFFYNFFSKISNFHVSILNIKFRPEDIILSNFLIPPPVIRPTISNDGQVGEDDLTVKLKTIIGINNKLARDSTCKVALQEAIASYFDSKIVLSQKNQNVMKKSIVTRLKGKTGRIRGNLMGKRVDFCARTVITGDPTLKISEIGIPQSIANTLTYPEICTVYNIEKLQKYVNNGFRHIFTEDPETVIELLDYPEDFKDYLKYLNFKYFLEHNKFEIKLENQFDKYIQKQNEEGNIESNITLDAKTRYKLTKVFLWDIFNPKHSPIYPYCKLISKVDEFGKKKVSFNCKYYKGVPLVKVGDIIERTLVDGDWIVFNRQPSLHKFSMMGHQVKVMPGSTFRMNVAACTPYNADFDGDEMNVFVPQSVEAISEIKELMSVNSNLVGPQSNKPVIGIVQDPLLGAMLLTRDNVKLNKEDMFQMIVNTDMAKYPIPDSSGWYTGKSIISICFPNDFFYRNGDVVIENGQMIAGTLTKKTGLGTSNGSIIHVLFLDYSPTAAAYFIDTLSQITNSYLLYHGFSVGIGDCIGSEDNSREIKQVLSKLKDNSNLVNFGSISSQVRKITNQNIKTTNNFKLMEFAGSKGSTTNIAQIMSSVGGQSLGADMIPKSFTNLNRTLPHFPENCASPEANGFVSNCYIKGLSPSEFWFHSVASRVGVSDTALKTAQTGYNQRRLVKAMEDLKVDVDGSVRNSEGEIVMFEYGHDGFSSEKMEEQSIDMFGMTNDELEKFLE